jgi:organic hydroperoxide reductase OsmC/OhrA
MQRKASAVWRGDVKNGHGSTATVTFEKVGGHHAITKSHLDLSAQVPGATPQVFDAAVKAAETGVSRLKTLSCGNLRGCAP